MTEPAPTPASATPEDPGRWTLRSVSAACSLVLVVLALGLGGYIVGSKSGEDLDAARAEGVAVGQLTGAKAGDRQGYRSGYELGERQGYGGGYREAFRTAYQAAFRDAGLDAPSFTDFVDEAGAKAAPE
jgi:hypothetical protein